MVQDHLSYQAEPNSFSFELISALEKVRLNIANPPPDFSFNGFLCIDKRSNPEKLKQALAIIDPELAKKAQITEPNILSLDHQSTLAFARKLEHFFILNPEEREAYLTGLVEANTRNKITAANGRVSPPQKDHAESGPKPKPTGWALDKTILDTRAEAQTATREFNESIENLAAVHAIISRVASPNPRLGDRSQPQMGLTKLAFTSNKSREAAFALLQIIHASEGIEMPPHKQSDTMAFPIVIDDDAKEAILSWAKEIPLPTTKEFLVDPEAAKAKRNNSLAKLEGLAIEPKFMAKLVNLSKVGQSI